VLLVGAVGSAQPAALRPWFVAGAALASVLWFSALGYAARGSWPRGSRGPALGACWTRVWA